MTLDPAIADVVSTDPLNSPSHADLHQDVKANIERLLDGLPAVFQTTLTGGPTSGATVLSLGNIVVPALSVATIQYPSAFWSGNTDADGADDAWVFTIRDDSTAGAIRASLQQRQPAESSANLLLAFGLPFGEGRVTASSTARTYHACIQRGTGDGTITTQGTANWASVLVLADLS